MELKELEDIVHLEDEKKQELRILRQRKRDFLRENIEDLIGLGIVKVHIDHNVLLGKGHRRKR